MKTRVLIIEDSKLIQQVLQDIIKSDPSLELVGTASNGEDGVKMAKEAKPDVVSLDVVMPDMDGLDVIEHLMKHDPLPVLVVSTLTPPDNAVATQAIEMGAVDCLQKPTSLTASLDQFRKAYIKKLKDVAAVPREKIRRNVASVSFGSYTPAKTIVVIGSAVGGTPVLSRVVSEMPADLPASILVAQHLTAALTKPMVVNLAAASKLRVKEAEVGDVFAESFVFVAPGNQTLKVKKSQGGWSRVNISAERPPETQMRPWIDAAMESAAAIFGHRCIGVLLSGSSPDGVKGMTKVKAAGGLTLAQDEASSIHFGMAKAAITAGVVDKVLPLEKIAGAIIDRVRALAKS